MKLGPVVLAMVLALPATATFAQTGTPGSPAARQDVGDPLVQHRTSEQKAAGITRRQARHNAPKLREHIGGPLSSQQNSARQ
jgi:hypothetical protein